MNDSAIFQDQNRNSEPSQLNNHNGKLRNFMFEYCSKQFSSPSPTIDSKSTHQAMSKKQFHPFLKKKHNFIVSEDLLGSLKPLLINADQTFFFCDTFFDSPKNNLLKNEGVWLIYRYFFDKSSQPEIKLRTSIKTDENDTNCHETIEWVEYQNEGEIIELLRMSELVESHVDDLMMKFGSPYLRFLTKRYYVKKDKFWVDFVGWADSIDELSDKGIFAVISATDDYEECIPKEILTKLNKNERVNKPLAMLYCRNPTLFENVFGIELKIAIPKCLNFHKFDRFLGLMKIFEDPVECEQLH